MRMREETIQVIINGKKDDETITLNKENPCAILYFENSDYAKHQAKGLTEKEAKIEELKRETMLYFEIAFNHLEELERIDPDEAEELRVDLGLEEYAYTDEDEVYLGGGVYGTSNLVELKPPAAVPDPEPAPVFRGVPVEKLRGFDNLKIGK